MYAGETDNTITIRENDCTLNFAQQKLIDEEFYGCGYSIKTNLSY